MAKQYADFLIQNAKLHLHIKERVVERLKQIQNDEVIQEDKQSSQSREVQDKQIIEEFKESQQFQNQSRPSLKSDNLSINDNFNEQIEDAKSQGQNQEQLEVNHENLIDNQVGDEQSRHELLVIGNPIKEAQSLNEDNFTKQDQLDLKSEYKENQVKRLNSNQPRKSYQSQNPEHEINNQYVTVQDIHKQLTVKGSMMESSVQNIIENQNDDSQNVLSSTILRGPLNKNSTADVMRPSFGSQPFKEEDHNNFYEEPQIQNANQVEEDVSPASYQIDPNVRTNHPYSLSPVTKNRQIQMSSFQQSESQPLHLPTHQSQQYEVIHTYRNSQPSEQIQQPPSHYQSSSIQGGAFMYGDYGQLFNMPTNTQNEGTSTQHIISTYRSGAQKQHPSQSLQNSTEENGATSGVENQDIESIIKKYNQLEEEEKKLRELLKMESLKQQSREIEMINKILSDTPLNIGKPSDEDPYQLQMKGVNQKLEETAPISFEKQNTNINQTQTKPRQQVPPLYQIQDGYKQSRILSRDFSITDDNQVRSDRQNALIVNNQNRGQNRKQDSIVTVDEQFNLQDFLQSQRKQGEQEQINLQGVNGNQKKQDLNEFKKHNSSQKNRPNLNKIVDNGEGSQERLKQSRMNLQFINQLNISNFQIDPRVYRQMQMKAKNKRIADYFMDPLMILNQSSFIPQHQFSQSQSPNKHLSPNKVQKGETKNGMASYRRPEPNQYFQTRHQSQVNSIAHASGPYMNPFAQSQIDPTQMVFNNISQLSEYQQPTPFSSQKQYRHSSQTYKMPASNNASRDNSKAQNFQYLQQMNFYPNNNNQSQAKNYYSASGVQPSFGQQHFPSKYNISGAQKNHSLKQSTDLIDLDQTYNLVESIRKQYSDEKQRKISTAADNSLNSSHLGLNLFNQGNFSSNHPSSQQEDSSESKDQINLDQKQKWDEVKRFMSKNPNVLMQILQIQEDKESQLKAPRAQHQVIRQGFFERRARDQRKQHSSQISSNVSSMRKIPKEGSLVATKKQLPNLAFNNFTSNVPSIQKILNRRGVRTLKHSQIQEMKNIGINHLNRSAIQHQNEQFLAQSAVLGVENFSAAQNQFSNYELQVEKSNDIGQLHRKTKSSFVETRRQMNQAQQQQFYPNTLEQRQQRKHHEVIIFDRNPLNKGSEAQVKKIKDNFEKANQNNQQKTASIQDYLIDTSNLEEYLSGNTSLKNLTQNISLEKLQNENLQKYVKRESPKRVKSTTEKEEHKFPSSLAQTPAQVSDYAKDSQVNAQENALEPIIESQIEGSRPETVPDLVNDEDQDLNKLSEQSHQIHLEAEILLTQRQALDAEKERIEQEKKDLLKQIEQMKIESKIREEKQKLEIERQKLQEDQKVIEHEKLELEKLRNLLQKQKEEQKATESQIKEKANGQERNDLRNETINLKDQIQTLNEVQKNNDESKEMVIQKMNLPIKLETTRKQMKEDRSELTSKPSSALNQQEQSEVSAYQGKSQQDQNSARIYKQHDWSLSEIMKDVIAKRITYNSQNQSHLYKETDMDYILESFKQRYKDFKAANLMDQLFQKAVATLKDIMVQLNMNKQLKKIVTLHREVNAKNTYKLLISCRLMMTIRQTIYETLSALQKHEALVQDIKKVVNQHLEHSIDEETFRQISNLAKLLPSITLQIKSNILKLRDENKILGKRTSVPSSQLTSLQNQDIGALHQSKNDSQEEEQILSMLQSGLGSGGIFIFKMRDALKQTLTEYEQVRNLVTVFDIKELPYISDKSMNNNSRDNSKKDKPQFQRLQFPPQSQVGESELQSSYNQIGEGNNSQLTSKITTAKNSSVRNSYAKQDGQYNTPKSLVMQVQEVQIEDHQMVNSSRVRTSQEYSSRRHK